MKKSLIVSFILVFSAHLSFSGEFAGKQASDIIPGTKYLMFYPTTNIPAFIKFNDETNIRPDEFLNWMTSTFKLDFRYEFRLFRQTNDDLGYTHYKYVQYFAGYPLDRTTYIVHAKGGRIVSMNGCAYDKVETDLKIILKEAEALKKALNYIGAEQYEWEIPSEEAFIKDHDNNPNATYYPSGELVLVSADGKSPMQRMAYKFNIYAHQPLSRAWYYIDAINGELVYKQDILYATNTKGTAYTKYSGKQTITTDSFQNSLFRLRETSRGSGVETYNMKKGTSYGSSVDFVDTNNIWNQFNANMDEAATDAHWGAEMTYDYLKTSFGRNSIDNAGMKIKCYVHYSTNYSNAFWNGSVMTFGDDGGTPFTVLDIIAHELQHGVSQYEANFGGTDGPALNESYSDIIATMVEFYARPSAANWQMGDAVIPIRNIASPKSMNDPNTYNGMFWDSVAFESHNNSTVQSYCFYLLAMGGKGTNDKGKSYNITGIGREKATAIFWRSLTTYLNNTSDYLDSRLYSIQAAADLYGDCSPEVNTLYQAWYAVGIGSEKKQLGFTTNDYLPNCFKNYRVDFENTSDAFTTYKWDFGDGSTSTAANPSHMYMNYGVFNVKLVGYTSCDTDSVVVNQFVRLDSNLSCAFLMPATTASSTLCHGILLDDGGTRNYNGNKDCRFTISPAGASAVILKFKSFAFEECGSTDCDYIKIFDGPTIASPLIGKYTGFSLPNGGTISSTGGSITIQQHSDPLQVYSGFELEWFCSNPNSPPITDFNSNTQNTCNGVIRFSDKSFNNPTSWLWDFGDGTTSNDQNPLHAYHSSGVYTVKLVVTNSHGTDSLVRTDFISINMKPINTSSDVHSCGSSSAKLHAGGFDIINWFIDDNPVSSPVFTGDTFTTPVLTNPTSYWVQGITLPDTMHAGPVDNAIGPGGYYINSSNHYLIFDAYMDMKLISARVYASGTSSRTIQLLKADGILLADTSMIIPNGTSRINLNFNIPIGSDLKLGCLGNNNLYRNTGGASFPYTIPGIVSIKETTAKASGSPNYYYYLYDWEIEILSCKSEKKKINVFIDSMPKANFTYSNKNHDVTFTNKSIQAREYMWDFGDGIFDTAVNPVHAYSLYGDFNVKLVAISSCGSDTFIKKITITSVFENKINCDVTIYPNPAYDRIHVKVKSAKPGDLHIRLVNSLNQEVYRKVLTNLSETLESIDVSKLPAGIYFINLADESGSETRKILVE